jgi:hypothetical protein
MPEPQTVLAPVGTIRRRPASSDGSSSSEENATTNHAAAAATRHASHVKKDHGDLLARFRAMLTVEAREKLEHARSDRGHRKRRGGCPGLGGIPLPLKQLRNRRPIQPPRIRNATVLGFARLRDFFLVPIAFQACIISIAQAPADLR